MCYSCYKEYGCPAIVNEATKHAAKLVEQVYEWSCVGGNAHIVLDDFNIEDSSIDWCLKDATSLNIRDACQEQLDVERECLLAFKSLTIEERASALALFEGWIE